MDQRGTTEAEGMGAVVGKTVALFFAWLGTWGLADLQIMVGIISGLAFAGYTIAQWRALTRRERMAEADRRDQAEDRRRLAQDVRDEARDQRHDQREQERRP